jgi:putative component of membrane protein insertase Oxa1/YidC/SpoIIIJ protein YidD
VVSAQNYVFYFESDIAKIFQFRPTCSSYDSEIIKKSKRGKKEPAKKVNKCQTWISSVVYIVRVLCVLKNIDLMSTLSSLRVSYDPNTIAMLSFTCCNVKYDVIKQILTWR